MKKGRRKRRKNSSMKSMVKEWGLRTPHRKRRDGNTGRGEDNQQIQSWENMALSSNEK